MTGFEKYRKKPVVIEAFRVTDEMHKDLMATKGGTINEVRFLYSGFLGVMENPRLVVKTLEGEHIVSAGDRIIKGIKNEIYPCKNDIFKMTYDKVGGGLISVGNTMRYWLRGDHVLFLLCGFFLHLALLPIVPIHRVHFLLASVVLWWFALLWDYFEKGEGD